MRSYLRRPTSTILLINAHCCSAKLVFFSAKHVSALPSTFRLCREVFLLCQAFFFCSDRFFGSAKQFFLWWARLCPVKHFSAMLSTLRLYQAFFFYTERFIRSAKHFSHMLKKNSALPSIFLLCSMLGRAEKNSAAEFFFCSAKHFFWLYWGLLCSGQACFLLCRAVHSTAEKYTAEQKKQHRR